MHVMSRVEVPHNCRTHSESCMSQVRRETSFQVWAGERCQDSLARANESDREHDNSDVPWAGEVGWPVGGGDNEASYRGDSSVHFTAAHLW